MSPGKRSSGSEGEEEGSDLLHGLREASGGQEYGHCFAGEVSPRKDQGRRPSDLGHSITVTWEKSKITVITVTSESNFSKR